MKYKPITYRHFDTWLAARNTSCTDYNYEWHRIGCKEGFVMIHVASMTIVALIVIDAA